MEDFVRESEEIQEGGSFGDFSAVADPLNIGISAGIMPHDDTDYVYGKERSDVLQMAPSWWLFDEEGMDILENAGTSLDKMLTDLNISPVIINQNEQRIFEARYEFPQYKKEFQHADAILTADAVGFIDFASGVPYGCIEKIGLIGEVFSDENTIGIYDGGQYATPPVPDEYFEEDIDGMVLVYNLIWLDNYNNVMSLAENLEGEEEPQYLWWFRFNLVENENNSNTAPTPGEFIGIAIYIFPTYAWGWQITQPFLYSGNWMETVYYTSAIVLEVIDATTYLINYRGEEIEAKSSDYAIYNVDDRVTILKGVEHKEDSMTWKDVKEYDLAIWSIIPTIFYYSEVT